MNSSRISRPRRGVRFAFLDPVTQCHDVRIKKGSQLRARCLPNRLSHVDVRPDAQQHKYGGSHDDGQITTGAGIVAGSDPDAELRETRLKLRAMLGALVEL